MSKVCCRSAPAAGCNRAWAHAPPRKSAAASANDAALISSLLPINRSRSKNRRLLQMIARWNAQAIIPYDPPDRRFQLDENGGWGVGSGEWGMGIQNQSALLK